MTEKGSDRNLPFSTLSFKLSEFTTLSNYSSSLNRIPKKPKGRLRDGKNMLRVKFHS